MRGFGAVAAVVAVAGGAMAEAPTGSMHDSAYGFSFAVPTPQAVREYTPEALSVGRPAEGDGFDTVADIRLHVAGEGEDYPSFGTFAEGTLRNQCAADGPEGTTSCGEVRQRQPFATAGGMQGEVLYLDRVHQSFATDARTVDGFGPVFLLDVSARVPGDGWAALAVQPPAHLPAEEVDSVLLRRIAESLAFGR